VGEQARVVVAAVSADAGAARFTMAVTIIHLDLDNVEGEPGDYLITLSAADPVRMGAGATQKLSLRAKPRGAASIPVSASGAGSGAAKVSAGGPAGFAVRTPTGSFGLWTVGGDSGSTPTSPTFSPAPASRNWRYRRQPSNWRSTGCATASPISLNAGKNGGSDLAYGLYVLAHNAWRRSATSPPRRRQARFVDDADRKGAGRSRAGVDGATRTWREGVCEIERQTYIMERNLVDATQVKQNTRLAVVRCSRADSRQPRSRAVAQGRDAAFCAGWTGLCARHVIDATGPTDSVLVRIDDATSARLSPRAAQ
jgi:hypothetical protein